MKQIYSQTSDVFKDLKDFTHAFIKRGYQSKILDHHFEKVMSVDGKILSKNKERLSTQEKLPLVITFNETVPNI